jgi:hypothetical protein
MMSHSIIVKETARRYLISPQAYEAIQTCIINPTVYSIKLHKIVISF